MDSNLNLNLAAMQYHHRPASEGEIPYLESRN
jgi:hypothetical protein